MRQKTFKTSLDLPLYCTHQRTASQQNRPEQFLDLNNYLTHPQFSTFLMKIGSNSMCCFGLTKGDLLIIDRSLEYKDGQLVVSIIDFKFKILILSIKDNELFLGSSNNQPVFKVEEPKICIWGVVKNVIRRF